MGDVEFAAGQQEAVVVLGHLAVEPLGAGVGADEDEEAADVEVAALSGARLFDHQPGQGSVAVDLADLGVEQHLDVLDRLDLLDQVVRHRGAEVAAAEQQEDPFGGAGEEDRRLAGRVAAADHRHRPAPAHPRLDQRRRVEDAGAVQPRAAVDRQLAVGGAGGEDDGARRQFVAAVEGDDVAAVFVAQAEGALGDRGAQAEPARLRDRPLGQLGAGDAGREAEVVLDPRRGARLAAERGRVDHHRREPLGRRVDGGAEAARAAADDQRVPGFFRRLVRGAQVERGRRLEDRRRAQHLVAGGQHRQVVLGERPAVGRRRRQVGAVEVDEAVRHPVAGEELAQVARPRVAAVADQPRAAFGFDDDRATADQRVGDQVAEPGVAGDDAAERLAADEDRLARLGDAGAEERRFERDQVQLTGELAGPVADQDALVRGVDRVDDLDAAG